MSKNGTSDLHNIEHEHLHIPAGDKLAASTTHKPRILLLYGSLRAVVQPLPHHGSSAAAGALRRRDENL